MRAEGPARDLHFDPNFFTTSEERARWENSPLGRADGDKRLARSNPDSGTAVVSSGCRLADRVRNLVDSDDSGTVAVRVGEKKFNQADLQRFFDTRLSDFRDPAHADKVKSSLLEAFIDEKLLLHQAERLKVQSRSANVEVDDRQNF